jgi:competence protein ComEC
MMALDIHFLDVGHGDCTIIDFPNHLTVVDINNCKTLARESEEEIKHKYNPPAVVPNPFLYGLGGGLPPPPGLTLSALMKAVEADKKLTEAKDRLTSPIDYLNARFAGRGIFRYIQSHPDMDHMAGLYRLTEEKIPIDNFWDTRHCISKDEDAMRTGQVNHDIHDWHTYLRLRKGPSNPTVLNLTAGDTGDFWTGDGIQIWAPFDHRHENEPGCDPNALSYVLFIQVGKCNIVLGGDATEETWCEIFKRRQGVFPKVHLLKASHHGRKSGYHVDSVKAMNPDVTILSVGELKAKDDASASYERFSIKGCHSTVGHGNIVAKCWEDGEVWLYDAGANILLRTFQ